MHYELCIMHYELCIHNTLALATSDLLFPAYRDESLAWREGKNKISEG